VGHPDRAGEDVITELDGLTVRVVHLRTTLAAEPRVQLVDVASGEPLISLVPGEAAGLGWMLRAHARLATD